MSNSDLHANSVTEERKPIQFSIAFLLWLTAVCAFVLGVAIWTPCFFNPVLAAAIATILTIAYRQGRRALWCSLIFGAATIAIARLQSLQIGTGVNELSGRTRLRLVFPLHSLDVYSPDFEPPNPPDRIVTNAGLKKIENLPFLRKMAILGVPLTDAALEHLQHVPQLQQVHVEPHPMLPTDSRKVTESG